MSKLTALEVVNEVLRNVGEATVSGISSLSGIQLVVWNKIIEAIQDICTDQDTRLQFLEASGAIPMVTGSYQYLISGLTAGSDLMNEDRESFLCNDNGGRLIYKTPQEWDELYKSGITSSRTGYPDEFTKYAGYFVFNNIATSVQNGKNITFRYWKLPTYYSTSNASGTCDIPEPFDRILLVPLATLKVLLYLGGTEEVSAYKAQVFGNGSDIEGSLDKMKRIYTSPIIKPRVTYKF